MGALGAGRTWGARGSGFIITVGVSWILLHCLAYASQRSVLTEKASGASQNIFNFRVALPRSGFCPGVAGELRLMDHRTDY